MYNQPCPFHNQEFAPIYIYNFLIYFIVNCRSKKWCVSYVHADWLIAVWHSDLSDTLTVGLHEWLTSSLVPVCALIGHWFGNLERWRWRHLAIKPVFYCCTVLNVLQLFLFLKHPSFKNKALCTCPFGWEREILSDIRQSEKLKKKTLLLYHITCIKKKSFQCIPLFRTKRYVPVLLGACRSLTER